MHGRALSMLQLGSCASRTEVLAIVLDHAAAMSLDAIRARRHANSNALPPDWLMGGGVRANAWNDDSRWPTLAELDAISLTRPICLMSFDHHAVAANSAALHAAGIRHDSPDPPKGLICRDPATGAPTGLLLESAATALLLAAPQIPERARRETILAALNDLARHGFTSVHDMLSPPWLGPVLADLYDAGELSMEVWLYAPLAELSHQAKAAQAWRRPTLRLAGAKIFADGTLNSTTAWMLSPYVHPLPGLPRGSCLMDASAIAHAIETTQAIDENLGLAIHAIGDAAVRAALDAAAHTRTGGFINEGGRGVPRLRIEHCELIAPTDVPRFARQEIVASIQPCHLLTDIEVLTRELPDQLSRVLPLRDLIDSGCTPGDLLWFGSDTPIVRPDPEDSFIAATLRGRDDASPTRIAPEQAISRQECTAAFNVRNSPSGRWHAPSFGEA